MFPSFSTIKEDARAGLSGVWKGAVGREFLFLLTGGLAGFYAVIALIATLLVSVIFDKEINIVAIIVSIVILTALLTINSGIRLSANKYYMSLVKNPTRDPNPSDCNLMGRFASRFNTTIQVHTTNAVLCLFLIVPGIISMLKYSMVDFVLADNPDMRPAEAMNESAMLMEGHKANYLKFCLSFLPWFILAIIPFGLGLFWLVPYFNMASAHYYDCLVNPEWENSADNDEIKTISAEHFSYKDFVEELEHKRGSMAGQNRGANNRPRK